MSLPELSMKCLLELRDKTNKLFRKNGIVFVHKSSIEQEQVKSVASEQGHPIHQLHIEKTDIPALYEQITNATKFQQTVNQVVKVDSQELLKQIKLLLSTQQEDMPNDVKQGIESISKQVVQFQKRLLATLKTSFEDCNEVTDVQEKARELITKSLREGLIIPVMPAILSGIQSNPSYYRYLVDYFSDFLSQYGIYTNIYQVNQPVDYNYLTPESVEKTNDKSLHGTICDLLLLPYFFNDERYEGQALLCEGQCVAWRFEEIN